MADLLQFLVKTPVTPKAKFYSGGVLTDLDGPAGGTCTVTLTKPDGTPGPASGTVTHVSTGIYSFVLDGPADPTVYDIAWSGQIGSRPVVQTTQTEALGELLFIIPDLRGFKVAGDYPFATTAVPLFTDEQLMDARAAVLDEFEDILGFSPVPRFAREVHDGDGSSSLVLRKLHAHRDGLLSIKINGVAQAVGDYSLRPSGMLRATSNYVASGTFTAGADNVAVEYVAGWERVEGIGRDAAMVMAAKILQPSGFSNATSVTTPDGMTYSYTPSEVGRGNFRRYTGIRDLDEWLNRRSEVGLAVA